eukprot:2665645-Prymnesium_polylepis.1
MAPPSHASPEDGATDTDVRGHTRANGRREPGERTKPTPRCEPAGVHAGCSHSRPRAAYGLAASTIDLKLCNGGWPPSSALLRRAPSGRSRRRRCTRRAR